MRKRIVKCETAPQSDVNTQIRFKLKFTGNMVGVQKRARARVAFLLLITLHSLHISSAWKPIVTSGSSNPITTYSLKQSHPGEASSSHELATSFAHFGGNKDDEDLVLPHSAVLNGVETGVASVADPISHPITINDDQYESYSLVDDDDVSIKEHSLSFSRTPLYVSDSCSVKKFAFNQDGAVDYKNELPELNQFTLCFWMRFTNHSGDHVLLTYEAEKEPREIQIWVANAQNSSFLSMAIKGQQMYRLNYPLRMRQWHHMCSSWNGKTGEWQVWLKAERIGRGFHNSLVGHKVPSKGKLRSGGSSITGEVSQGLHFEVTLVQIYRVALSAGKAHRDHKHHHVHHFDHEGQEVSSTPRAPPMINRPQPMHSLLASGQIPTRVRINLANAGSPQNPPNSGSNGMQLQSPQQQAITVNTNFVNGQINTGSRLVAQQLLGITPIPQSRPISPLAVPLKDAARFQMLSNSANVQFIDETETHIQFKRHVDASALIRTVATTDKNEKKLRKRGLVLLDDGTVVDDGLGSSEIYSKYNGLADFGGQQFKQELTMKMTLEEEISSHDREPAEEEVKAVMAICSSCDQEPFQGAIVFAWKNVREHMNNALKGLSVGNCGNF